MKKNLLLPLTILLFSTTVTSQRNSANGWFTLKGEVVGQDTGFVYLKYRNGLGKYVNDSCYLTNGRFELKGILKEPTIASFYGNIISRSVDDPNFTEIFLEPTKMSALFKVNNFKKGEITGSITHNQLSIYNNRKDSLNNKWNVMWDAIKDARAKKNNEKIDSIYNNEMPIFRSESDKLSYNFIKQYPQSVVSSNILLYKTQKLSIDSLKMFYSVLSNAVEQSHDGKEIKDFITKAENLTIGKQAPNFTQTNLNGINISLADFRGKYVLLDFWASWCIPCREEHPYLKQAYSKYNSKGFTIIGLSLDRAEDKDAWLAAIEKDGLPWTQLCDFKVWDSPVIKIYNLYGKGIPANYLIGPNGEIVAKDLRGTQLEKKLEELIK